MKRVIITLELEDEKFDAMEKILLRRGINRNAVNAEEWDKFVIEQYNRTEPYLECWDGNLEKAYEDMIFDF